MANLIHNAKGKQIPAVVTLASADDLDGTLDGTQYLAVPKGARVLIEQINNGTAGTAGVDVIEVSIANGAFIADPTLVAVADPDQGGTLITSLNAAGVEPTGAASWKSGPFAQDARMRCGRKTTDSLGTTWVTGAPTVRAILIKGRN